jgi:hypothetical protein
MSVYIQIFLLALDFALSSEALYKIRNFGRVHLFPSMLPPLVKRVHRYVSSILQSLVPLRPREEGS